MMKKKIAVIGSGMAGLAAGWLCRKAGTDVTIFEAQSSRGMDFHTQFLDGNDGRSGHVDVPLRVMSPHAWPTVLKLCDTLDVKTFEVDTPVACSWLPQGTWFRSIKFQFGSREIPWAPLRYLTRPETYRMLSGFLQIYRAQPKSLDSDLTIEEFKKQKSKEVWF